MIQKLSPLFMLLFWVLIAPGCQRWECQLEPGSDPDSARMIGCLEDFEMLAAAPLDASLPGARSVKTVLDRLDENNLFYQNSQRYLIHWDFAFEHRSGNGLPIVPELGAFNNVEYYSPDRRFILGAITYYEEPAVWAYEIAPYDSADADMITLAYRSIVESSYFGKDLKFHPTSAQVELVAESLPDDVDIITTDELFDGITYQPLNLATSMGQLRFYRSAQLDDAPPNFREIVVLDAVPNDIGVVSGIITEAFQTPLSHINVLSQNRGTPNMGLRGAFTNEELRGLEDKWVELTVGAFEWTVREVTQQEADTWWEENRPDPIDVQPMDTSVTELVNDVDILDLDGVSLRDAIAAVVPAFGGKASHYGGLALIEDFPNPKAFVVPVFYYDQHMEVNGLWTTVETLLADPTFRGDALYRRDQLTLLRDAIKTAPISGGLMALITDKLNAEFPATRMRFRSSTNAEDLNGFNGAGLYTSKSGDPNDPAYPIDVALRTVWASVWSDRAYDEREYYGMNHRNIGMALLSHRSFPNEDANGVAITGNIFDPSGLEPAFYVNVQEGGESVVQPATGITSDQFLYYYDRPGQPIVFLDHSNLVPSGETVLTNAETYELGTALQAIHQYYFTAYGSGGGFYGMDVEFKFDSRETGSPELYVKQARPYPGRGQ